jgi:hypothetical protein
MRKRMETIQRGIKGLLDTKIPCFRKHFVLQG